MRWKEACIFHSLGDSEKHHFLKKFNMILYKYIYYYFFSFFLLPFSFRIGKRTLSENEFQQQIEKDIFEIRLGIWLMKNVDNHICAAKCDYFKRIWKSNLSPTSNLIFQSNASKIFMKSTQIIDMNSSRCSISFEISPTQNGVYLR